MNVRKKLAAIGLFSGLICVSKDDFALKLADFEANEDILL